MILQIVLPRKRFASVFSRGVLQKAQIMTAVSINQSVSIIKKSLHSGLFFNIVSNNSSFNSKIK
ncbi:MAG: hypothetical protein BWK80_43335 [Desulfobacteraceae bacterium IS3]|nr:MAG: hypothetical protein BWK80_43335 [Desulfobacteraceae bacterium IS3]